MNTIFSDYSKHFKEFILEFAALVFLAITAPFWVPIAGILVAGGLGLAVLGAVLIFLLALCSRAQSMEMNFLEVLSDVHNLTINTIF